MDDGPGYVDMVIDRSSLPVNPIVGSQRALAGEKERALSYTEEKAAVIMSRDGCMITLLVLPRFSTVWPPRESAMASNAARGRRRVVRCRTAQTFGVIGP